MSDLSVHVTGIPEAEPSEERLWAWARELSPGDRARVFRFRRWEDRCRALGGALLARRALGERIPADPAAIRIERTSSGRPVLVDPHHFPGDFNVSHHGVWVGVAVVPDGFVGFDIVLPEEFTDDVAVSILSDGERAQVAAQPPPERPRTVARLWALKEAYLKMMGTGLLVDPARLSFDLWSGGAGSIRLYSDLHRGDSVSFSVFDWQGALMATAASGAATGRPKIIPVDWQTLFESAAVRR